PRRGMRNAMKNAGINPEQVQYVNAHGTSTPLGDKNETEALKLAFGDHASKLVINSTKSMTGHLLGAAGGIEAIFATLAVHHQVSPPTINIFNQDPECDLDYCANSAREMAIEYALPTRSALAAPMARCWYVGSSLITHQGPGLSAVV